MNYELCVIEAKKAFDELREAKEKEDQSIAVVTDKAFCAVLGLAHVLTPENSPSSCGNNTDDWKTEHWNSALAEYMFKLIAKERELGRKTGCLVIFDSGGCTNARVFQDCDSKLLRKVTSDMCIIAIQPELPSASKSVSMVQREFTEVLFPINCDRFCIQDLHIIFRAVGKDQNGVLVKCARLQV